MKLFQYANKEGTAAWNMLTGELIVIGTPSWAEIEEAVLKNRKIYPFILDPEEEKRAKKEALIGKIKNEITSRLFSNVKVGSKWYNIDQESRNFYCSISSVFASCRLEGRSIPLFYVRSDKGVEIQATTSFMTTLFEEMAIKENEILKVGAAYLDDAEKTNDPDKFDYSKGWPD